MFGGVCICYPVLVAFGRVSSQRGLSPVVSGSPLNYPISTRDRGILLRRAISHNFICIATKHRTAYATEPLEGIARDYRLDLLARDLNKIAKKKKNLISNVPLRRAASRTCVENERLSHASLLASV